MGFANSKGIERSQRVFKLIFAANEGRLYKALHSKIFMRYFFATISTIIFIAFPPKEKDCIVWKENRRLKWEDFESHKPGKRPDIAAMSSIQLRLHSSIKKSKIKWNIQCVFIKYKSWATLKTDYVLNHEQKHFDIGEVYARLFRKTIEENKEIVKASDTFKIDSLFKVTVKQLISRQSEYDSMTNHSNNYEEQIRWDSLITNELNDLKEYSN